LYDDAEEFIYEEADQKDLRGEEPYRQHGIVPRKKQASADPIAFALKQADMLKDLGEGIAKGVEGLAGQVGKSLEDLKEAEEEKEKEQEKLDKAVARNVRERKARKLAKKYAALGTYGVDMGLGMSGTDITTSSDQLRKLLQWRPKKKKKKRSGKNYERELELQTQRTLDKLMFEEARHENLMEELEFRQTLAKTGGILPEEGPIANVLTAVGVKKSKKKKEEEAERRKAQRAAQLASDAAANVKTGAPIAKKRREFAKGATQAAPQQSYANPQPSLTAQRQDAHNAMNNQAAGVGSQQPPLTPEDSQVLAQRPQAQLPASQRPHDTAAYLGRGPLTGDQFGPGNQSVMGMAVTASTRSQGDLIDRALRNIEKQAWVGGALLAGTAGVGYVATKRQGKKQQQEKWEREELEEWQRTAKDDEVAMIKKIRQETIAKKKRLKELQKKAGFLTSILGLAAASGGGGDKAAVEPVPATRKTTKLPSIRGLAGGAIGGTAGGLLGAGGAAGATIGGLHGLFSNPGEDEEGERRSRLWRAVKGLLAGGALGVAGTGAGLAGGAVGGVLGGKLGYRIGEKKAETSLLPGPFDLAGTAIAGGLGGAGIGAIINAVRGRSLKRGLITGGLTGAGTLSGHELGSNLSRNRAAEFAGGWGGTGFGGYGGYQLAQAIQGPDEEEKKKKKKRAKKASADPLEFVLSITKSSAPAPYVKQRRKGAPRSVTIKKPSRVCPDTGEVTPGSSSITHIARPGKKIR
jgi:hypothetical protein